MVRFAAAALALAASALGIRADGADILLLDFWSPSCGPCMQMKPTIKNFKNAGYPIREVEVGGNQELVRQFRVDRMPCFVMLVDGQEVDRTVGFTSSEHIQQMFERAKSVVQSRARTRGQSPDSRASAVGLPSPVAAVAHPEPPTPNAVSPAELPAEVNQNLLAATVRLKVDDATGHSYGTGTIIDARSGQALVITCGHLFRDSKGQGPISVELFEVDGGNVRPARLVRAQLINYDLNRDVALVGIWPGQPVTVARVAAKGSAVGRGDRVVCVGCSNGNDPTVIASRVTTLDRYQGPPNIEASGAPVEGRSGGGLFNANGELIGVCFAADYEGNEGLYAALESIHGQLADCGLGEIGGQPVQLANGSPDRLPADAVTAVVRGQEPPLTPVLPIPNPGSALPSGETAATTRPADGNSVPQGLSAVEQAAWDEIMARAGKAEVICIIRPKEPGGQSEVITLDEASPEFVRGLAARQKQPSGSVVR